MAGENLIQIRAHELYFGVTMNFTDHNGNNYPESFWLQDFTLKGSTKYAEVTDIGYRSIEDFEAGNPPIGENDGGIVRRIFRGAEFDAFVLDNAQIIAQMAVKGRATSLSLKDVPDGAGNMVSRFQGASPIIMPTGFGITE